MKYIVAIIYLTKPTTIERSIRSVLRKGCNSLRVRDPHAHTSTTAASFAISEVAALNENTAWHTIPVWQWANRRSSKLWRSPRSLRGLQLTTIINKGKLSKPTECSNTYKLLKRKIWRIQKGRKEEIAILTKTKKWKTNIQDNYKD